MNLRLSEDWKNILKRAWSVRLMALAALLSGAEVMLPFFADELPRGVFAGFSALTVSAAFVARVLAQKDLS